MEDISPFCGATDTPVLDFWWRLPWVSKHGGSLACILCHLHAMDSPDSPLMWHLLYTQVLVGPKLGIGCVAQCLQTRCFGRLITFTILIFNNYGTPNGDFLLNNGDWLLQLLAYLFCTTSEHFLFMLMSISITKQKMQLVKTSAFWLL